MADDRVVVVTIKSEYDGKGDVNAKKALEEVKQASKQATDVMQKGANSSANAFATVAKKLGTLYLSFAGLQKVIGFFASSVTAANENARAVNTLAAAYQAVGYTTEGAMKQAQEFATRMQNLTGIADEAFLNAQRLLANYGVVGTKAQEAIQAAYALSIGRSIDFATAMDLVSKAAVGQTQTLSRYGIVLGDNVAEGEKFNAVLAQINERFGATAQAAMGDSTTKLNALKESWGDFKEQVGAGLNEGLAPAVDFLTKGVGVLNQVFKSLGAVFGIVFDNMMIRVQELKGSLFAMGQSALNTLTPVVKLMSFLPGVGNEIKTAFDNAKSSLGEMKENAFAQADTLEKMRTPLSAIWETEKAITEQQKTGLKANEDLVNSKRKLAQATEEVAKAEQKAREEQLKALDNLGLSTSKDLKGWGRDEQSSQQGPTDMEVFAGGQNELGAAADAVAQYDAEAERLESLRELKLQYIEQEITDEQLKQEALANLEAQYAQQQQNLAKNQAKARQQVYASMWSSLASLANNENKKVAAVGKIAGVAQATISTFTGAAKALELPFPANLAAMATVLAQGFALVSQIQGVKLADGGLVKAVTGGVPAVIGEGGSDEAVLPLDNANAMRRIGGAIAEESGAVGGVVLTQNITIQAGESLIPDITNALRNATVDALEMANLTVKVGNGQQGYSV